MRTLSRYRRSLMDQFRLLPLEIETPIYDIDVEKNRNIYPSERVCKLCNTGECEDEIHFMFACPLYNDIRESILEPVHKNNERKSLMSDSEKIYDGIETS